MNLEMPIRILDHFWLGF